MLSLLPPFRYNVQPERRSDKIAPLCIHEMQSALDSRTVSVAVNSTSRSRPMSGVRGKGRIEEGLLTRGFVSFLIIITNGYSMQVPGQYSGSIPLNTKKILKCSD